ncbi:MAG: hypothetical protein WCO42_02320 [bacterium]
MKYLNYALLFSVLLLVSGCVSTPDSRIKKEPRLFAAFPPDVQAKVQKGDVEVGFTRDMARLALGLPQRLHTRTVETGELEIWIYTNSRFISDYQPMSTGYWYRDRAGRLYRSYDTLWVNRGWYEDYPVLQLEFSGDKLKAIERMKR